MTTMQTSETGATQWGAGGTSNFWWGYISENCKIKHEHYMKSVFLPFSVANYEPQKLSMW